MPVSVKFTKGHPRAGEKTYFIPKIELALELVNNTCSECVIKHGNSEKCKICFVANGAWPKLHTIRGKYERWVKIMDEVQAGRAVVDLYYWDGKPYGKGVKQVVFATLDKDSGCGVQKLEFYENKDGVPCIKYPIINNISEPVITQIAKNDGLSLDNFKAWFKRADLSQPMAIIHFTSFRY